jgi:hypothetical protein
MADDQEAATLTARDLTVAVEALRNSLLGAYVWTWNEEARRKALEKFIDVLNTIPVKVGVYR